MSRATTSDDATNSHAGERGAATEPEIALVTMTLSMSTTIAFNDVGCECGAASVPVWAVGMTAQEQPSPGVTDYGYLRVGCEVIGSAILYVRCRFAVDARTQGCWNGRSRQVSSYTRALNTWVNLSCSALSTSIPSSLGEASLSSTRRLATTRFPGRLWPLSVAQS